MPTIHNLLITSGVRFFSGTNVIVTGSDNIDIMRSGYIKKEKENQDKIMAGTLSER